MNKKLLTILTLIIVIIMTFALVACDEDPDSSGGSGGSGALPSGSVSITLDKTSLNLEMGQSATIVAIVDGTNGIPTWTSSNDGIARVINGKVTAVADGSATITAKIGDTTATCAVTVSSRETVFIDRESLKLFKDESVKLSAVVKKGLIEQNSSVTWSVSDDSYISVDSDGVVTGKKVTAKSASPVTVTATSPSGASQSIVVTVEKIVNIILSDTEVTLHPNGEKTAAISVSGKDGSYSLTARGMEWTSSDPDVVEVSITSDVYGNSMALLTAKKSGNVTVTGSVKNSSEVAVINVESWYAISTPDDMEYLRSDINGIFKLVNDIDFQGATWDGVTKWAGDSVPDSEYFGGILDGQGYAIKNINIQSGWNNAIIGQTNTTSIVRNLSVINLVNADTSNKVGSVVSFNKGLIENCYIEHTIQNDGPSNWNAHGGIVATNAQAGVIRNCIIKVTASRTFNNAGALIGYNCGVVENCYAICTDAVLPMYAEWSNTLGSFTDCGVYSNVEDFVKGAQLHVYSDKVWTDTGLDVPALYNYPEVSFDLSTVYFAQGNRYTLSPANVKGMPMEWSLSGNEDNIVVCEENADRALEFFARAKGSVNLTVTLANGSTASARIVVTGTVISPDSRDVAIDYNNPALSDTEAIVIRDEQGRVIDENVTYVSSNPDIATVNAYGIVTAKGAGTCYISLRYIEDDYDNLITVTVTGWTQISTPEQLQAMKDRYSLNYCLVNDIDFGGNVFTTITPYTSADSDALYFNGIFDGNGYTVSNLKVVGNDRGIWGRTATTAVIRNTNFVDIEFVPASGSTTQNTYGIVSYNTGTIRNIVVRAKVNGGHTTDYRTGGGVCGTNEFRGRIYNCISYVDVSAVRGTDIYLATLMGLCQGVAKDCFGIVVGSTDSTVSAISFINSSGVSNCKQYTSEQSAVSAGAPFGSFSTSVWNISDTAMPTLKHLC